MATTAFLNTVLAASTALHHLEALYEAPKIVDAERIATGWSAVGEIIGAAIFLEDHQLQRDRNPIELCVDDGTHRLAPVELEEGLALDLTFGEADQQVVGQR